MLRLSEKGEHTLLKNIDVELYLSAHVTHKQFEIEPVRLPMQSIQLGLFAKNSTIAAF